MHLSGVDVTLTDKNIYTTYQRGKEHKTESGGRGLDKWTLWT